MSTRTIVEIDETLCDGCGDCIPNCVEGALKVIDGKARLVSDVLCDGLGACLGHCPQDAIRMVDREAEQFDEAVVEKYHRSGTLAVERPATVCETSTPPRMSTPPPVCPGSMNRTLNPAIRPSNGVDRVGSDTRENPLPSQLSSWPVQLHLLNPGAPFLAASDLLLCADCVPFAYPDFHRDFLDGRTVAIGCPKLDHTGPYLEKLTAIFQRGIRSLTVLHMEVPCCGGLVQLAGRALHTAGVDIPVRVVQVSVRGEILRDVRH